MCASCYYKESTRADRVHRSVVPFVADPVQQRSGEHGRVFRLRVPVRLGFISSGNLKRIVNRSGLLGSPAMIAICGPAGSFGEAGCHDTAFAAISR